VYMILVALHEYHSILQCPHFICVVLFVRAVLALFIY
jgi:hypothetical protein